MRRTLIVAASFVVALAGIALIESRPGLASARLLECLLLLIPAIAGAWAARGVGRNVLLTICSLVFGIAVLEGVTLATKPREAPSGPIFEDSGLARPRAVLGWGPVRPGIFHVWKKQADGRVIYDTHVTIDENLNRKTVPSSGTRSIVFFGDSWIYGDGVEDDGTIPQTFADLNKGKIPVLNLGMAGWSPAQNLADLSMKLFKPPLDSPRHFILFTAPFHIERTSCKGNYAFSSGPRYVLDGDALKYAGSCTGFLSGLLMPVIRVVRRFGLYDRLEPYFDKTTKRDVETYIKILETFVATAKREHHVATTILFAPFDSPFLDGTGYTKAMVLDRLRKDGMDVLVDELPKIADDSLYMIPGDGHPSAFGNRERAKLIQAHLQTVDPGALKVTDEAAR